eukprot:31162-Pelagococcus_subviridis.AAC.12
MALIRLLRRRVAADGRRVRAAGGELHDAGVPDRADTARRRRRVRGAAHGAVRRAQERRVLDVRGGRGRGRGRVTRRSSSILHILKCVKSSHRDPFATASARAAPTPRALRAAFPNAILARCAAPAIASKKRSAGHRPPPSSIRLGSARAASSSRRRLRAAASLASSAAWCRSYASDETLRSGARSARATVTIDVPSSSSPASCSPPASSAGPPST